MNSIGGNLSNSSSSLRVVPKSHQSRFRRTSPIPGPNFVLLRPKVQLEEPENTISSSNPPPSLSSAPLNPSPSAAAVVVWNMHKSGRLMQGSSVPMGPFLLPGEVGFNTLLLPSAPAFAPNTSCTAMVPFVSAETAAPPDLEFDPTRNPIEEDPSVMNFNSTSPRRTKKIKFTCGICGQVNLRPINVQAFQKGTVFVECGNCLLKHKIVDHLGICHDFPSSTPHPFKAGGAKPFRNFIRRRHEDQ